MAEKKVKIWDNYEEVGEVRKSNGKKLVVSACTLNGYRYVSIHEYYRRATDNQWMRSAKVVSIPIKSTKDNGASWLKPLEALIPLLEAAGDVAASMDLENEENAIWKGVTK